MKTRSILRSERGSALVTALVLAAVIAISLTSYMKLCMSSLTLANRTFYNNAAINMAESGIDEAIWSFNQTTAGSTTAWNSPWSVSSGSARMTLSSFSFGANTTGAVKIYVDNNTPSGNVQPIVVAKATVTLPNNQGTINKYVEVKLRRRSLFATGLVAKDFIQFNGNNVEIDSWNSVKKDDGTARASPVPYSVAVKHAKGSIGSVSVTATVGVGNGDVFGTAGVGGTDSSHINVGTQGRVGPFGTAAGVKDPNSVTTDFTANLDTPVGPTTGTVVASLGGTVGTAGTTTSWRTASITNNLTVNGNVTIVLTAAAGTDAIKLAGSKELNISAGSSLTIYTDGNIDLTGKGVLNPNLQAISFQIYGTSTSTTKQDIKVAGNGTLTGVVYAPNASISIHGNGDVCGSFVGDNITLTGNAKFHYDESLADFGGNNPYGVVRWRELSTSAERSAYSSYLAF